MTAVLGLVHNQVVYLAGDSCSTAGDEYHIENYKKVFSRNIKSAYATKKKFKMVFGYTWSFRFGQILQYDLVIPDFDPLQDVFKYMVVSFIPALRQALSNGGLLEKNNEVETGGTCIIGFQGRLFTIYNDFNVSEPRGRYTAIGAGYEYCLAMLDYLMQQKEINPEDICITSLGIAANHCTSVRPPFHIENDFE